MAKPLGGVVFKMTNFMVKRLYAVLHVPSVKFWKIPDARFTPKSNQRIELTARVMMLGDSLLKVNGLVS